MSNTNRIMKLKEVMEATSMSRSTIYRWVANGQFPKYVKLSATSTGWYSSDIDSWMESLRNSEVV